jgi:DNA-binding LacI/PurR family transcriptional regulator
VTTIKAVAQLAGVSVSTVSYVLSGKRSIGEETRARVLDAIDELGYEPNASARALRSTRTHVLALLGIALAGQTEASVTGVLIFALADAVRERGFDLLLIPAHEGVAGLERLSRTAMADAVIVMGILMDDPRVAALQRLQFPAALMGNPERDPGIGWVDLDFYAAGTEAVNVLSASGHRDIAFVGQPTSVYDNGASYAVRALAGVRAGAATTGIRLTGPHYIENLRHVADVLTKLFESAPTTSAIILHFEEALPDVLRWLRASGHSVPEDVRVVLVGAWTRDNTESQVTYVTSTVERIASAAVELAIDASLGRPPRFVLLPPVLSVTR